MRRLLPSAALLLLLLPAAGADETRKAKWTVLVYMTADNNLEGFGVGDVLEMAKATPSDQVDVVVLCDRCEIDEPKEGKNYSGEPLGPIANFHSTKRIEIRGGRIREVADVGEKNMGDPATLEEFVTWGGKAYPAERYALVFWDHGSSWPGYGGDESHQEDLLTLGEIQAGLERGMKGGGIERFDLIGFDCCLMAGLETMRACRPFGRIFVASEELEPGYGWDYTSWLSALAEHPEMPATEVGRVICDSYQRFFDANPDPETQAEGLEITLAEIDLDKVPAVIEQLDAVAAGLDASLAGGDVVRWTAVARARHDSEMYGKSGDDCVSLDLRGFAGNLKGFGVDAARDALLHAIDRAVLHRVHGKDRPNGGGISIYFPLEPEPNTGEYAATAATPGWQALLGTYLAIEEKDQSPPAVGDLATNHSELGPGEAATVTARVDESEVADAAFVLAKDEGNRRIIMGMIPVEPAGGVLHAEFDGKWLAIGDAEHQVLAPITGFEEVNDQDDVYVAEIPALYQAPGETDWLPVTLYFEVDVKGRQEGGRFIYAYANDEDGPTFIRIEHGGRIKPIYAVVDEKNELELVTDEGAEPLTVGKAGLDIVEEDLPDGKYLVGFVVTDWADNDTESLLEVELKQG